MAIQQIRLERSQGVTNREYLRYFTLPVCGENDADGRLTVGRHYQATRITRRGEGALVPDHMGVVCEPCGHFEIVGRALALDLITALDDYVDPSFGQPAGPSVFLDLHPGL